MKSDARSESRRRARANRRAEGRLAIKRNAQKKGKHKKENESPFYKVWISGAYKRISSAAKNLRGKRKRSA